jgi:hypothetical protein
VAAAAQREVDGNQVCWRKCGTVAWDYHNLAEIMAGVVPGWDYLRRFLFTNLFPLSYQYIKRSLWHALKA